MIEKVKVQELWNGEERPKKERLEREKKNKKGNDMDIVREQKEEMEKEKRKLKHKIDIRKKG